MKSKAFYRPDIDGLRAIAVILVIAYHAALPGITGGFVGVDVFFVISGFLITRLLYEELAATSRIDLAGFYARRFKRLFPALLFVIVTSIVIWGAFFVGIPVETELFAESVRYGAFGFANIFFQRHTAGYFDVAGDLMPLLHFWSLAVEEQFYLVWPLLLLTCGRSGSRESLEKRVAMTLALLSIAAFVGAEYLLRTGQQPAAFYWMPPRAWELGLGGLVYLARPGFEARWAKSRGLLTGLGLVGIVAMIVSGAVFDARTRFPGAMAAVPALATAMIILAGGTASTLVDRFLSRSWMVALGTLSYGWYLWHWPLLTFARLHSLGGLPPLAHRLGAIVLSLGLAKLSLDFVEGPVRHGKWVAARRPRTIIATALGLGTGVALAARLLIPVETWRQTPESTLLIKLAEDDMEADSGCDGSSESSARLNCDFVYGEKGELLVWGDSHALSYFPLFREFARGQGLTVHVRTKPALLPLLGIKNSYSTRKVNRLGEFSQNVIDSLSRWEPGRRKKLSIVMAARWPAYTGTEPISVRDVPIYLGPEMSVDASMKTLETSLRETLGRLTTLGIPRILIVMPWPEFKYLLLHCHDPEICDIDRADLLRQRAPTTDILRRVAADFENVRLLDPAEVVCREDRCPQVLQDEFGQPFPSVVDDDHPSVPAVLYLGWKKAAELAWLLPQTPTAPAEAPVPARGVTKAPAPTAATKASVACTSSQSRCSR